MWCKPFHSLEDMTNHTKCHTRLNQCPIKSRTLFSAAVKPFCLRRYRSSPMCNVLKAAAGKGDILILAAISLCPIKHGKAFLAISVWLYFSRQIPSRSCNPCSQCTALEHQYLGRVLLRKQQTQFFRDEAQHPCQTRILLLTENYLKNFNTRHKILKYMQGINPALDIFQLLSSTSKKEINISAPNLEVLMCVWHRIWSTNCCSSHTERQSTSGDLELGIKYKPSAPVDHHSTTWDIKLQKGLGIPSKLDLLAMFLYFKQGNQGKHHIS